MNDDDKSPLFFLVYSEICTVDKVIGLEAKTYEEACSEATNIHYTVLKNYGQLRDLHIVKRMATMKEREVMVKKHIWVEEGK